MGNDVGLSCRSIVFTVVIGDKSESTLSALPDSESITGTLNFKDEDMMQTEAGKW